ncbi:hypothetical protein HKD37_17G047827 [Glycine soja]
MSFPSPVTFQALPPATVRAQVTSLADKPTIRSTHKQSTQCHRWHHHRTPGAPSRGYPRLTKQYQRQKFYQHVRPTPTPKVRGHFMLIWRFSFVFLFRAALLRGE